MTLKTGVMMLKIQLRFFCCTLDQINAGLVTSLKKDEKSYCSKTFDW